MTKLTICYKFCVFISFASKFINQREREREDWQANDNSDPKKRSSFFVSVGKKTVNCEMNLPTVPNFYANQDQNPIIELYLARLVSYYRLGLKVPATN